MSLSRRIRDFIKLESSSGVILMLAAILAMLAANSPLYETYDYFLHQAIFGQSILHWINDGLMTIFFFLVGLEIKREFVEGELSSPARAILPALAALGGMVVPAGIYWFINRDIPANLAGWAIPAATDIAFALGVLGLLGNRVPLQLKILLMAIAVLDDLGAIAIIGLFFSNSINVGPLVIAIFLLITLYILNRRGVSSAIPYICMGLAVWAVILHSGVHATLSGVAVAFFVPVQTAQKMIHKFHPWVAFFILPVFAFANAGVPFAGIGFHSMAEPLTAGIIAGLVIGKQLGIFTVLVVAIRSGFCPMPQQTTWKHLYGMSVLCGIGFTMSLFIGGLAFSGLEQQASIRLGVLSGSLVSALLGYAILYGCAKPMTDSQNSDRMASS